MPRSTDNKARLFELNPKLTEFSLSRLLRNIPAHMNRAYFTYRRRVKCSAALPDHKAQLRALIEDAGFMLGQLFARPSLPFSSYGFHLPNTN